MMKIKPALKEFLDAKVEEFNRAEFIEADPISVPHRFTKKQDIEIAGLMAAVFAWGQRKTIINKANEFIHLMDDSPHEFLLHHKPRDLKSFNHFKHRTFNSTDALYFIEFLSHYYTKHGSLEDAFQIMRNDEQIFTRYFSALRIFPLERRSTFPHLNEIRLVKESTCTCDGWCEMITKALTSASGKIFLPLN